MTFEWDPEKNKANRIKHGLSFERAIAIWESVHLEVEDIARSEEGERRGATLGWVGAKLYLAIWTRRADKLRLISVRRARQNEERVFTEKIQDDGGDG
jgi:uncharacterized DUF497 family protein